jgi:hypothetical protein
MAGRFRLAAGDFSVVAMCPLLQVWVQALPHMLFSKQTPAAGVAPSSTQLVTNAQR